MKVVIAGAGIAGLTTALCLHRRGIGCVVYEKAGEVRELGVGINLLPNAVQQLAELGLLAELEPRAVCTYELILANRHGQPIWRERRGRAAGHSVPQLSIHRGVLQRVLYDAAVQRLGAGSILTGKRFVDAEQSDNGVQATFGDPADGSHEVVGGDVLIGADGIHSAVRAFLNPAEGPPRWNGVMMWRGATDWPAFLGGQTMIVAGGTTGKLVVYPIGPGASAERRLTNWAVVSKIGEDGDRPPRREDWSRPGYPADLAPHVARFAVTELDVPGLIHATSEFFEYPMCDRDPLETWTQGRITLIGDAAHPMYPMGSNGGTQAMLDASVLAKSLAGRRPREALLAFESERRPPTDELVRLNRLGGPERVIDVVEERSPAGFTDLDDVISSDELAAIITGYGRAAGLLQR